MPPPRSRARLTTRTFTGGSPERSVLAVTECPGARMQVTAAYRTAHFQPSHNAGTMTLVNRPRRPPVTAFRDRQRPRQPRPFGTYGAVRPERGKVSIGQQEGAFSGRFGCI